MPDIETVLRTLALQYHTPESLQEWGFKGLRVIITEDDVIDGESFDEFAARLAESDA